MAGKWRGRLLKRLWRGRPDASAPAPAPPPAPTQPQRPSSPPLDLQPEAKAPTPAARLPMEGHVLGLDYGCAFSKVLLRDLSQNIALQVPDPREASGQAPGDPFGRPLPLGVDASPTRITFLEDRLYFGWAGVDAALKEGALAFPSMKRSYGLGWPPPRPYPGWGTERARDIRGALGSRGLVYLEGLYQAQRGAVFGASQGIEPRQWALSLPPGSQALHLPLRRAIARVKSGSMPDLREGLSLEEAKGLIREGEDLITTEGLPPFGDEPIIVGEEQASIAYFERAERLRDGLYCAISLGAGYASAMFFLMEGAGGGSPGRGHLLSSAHLNHGVDDLTGPLGRATSTPDFTTLRGNEGPLFVGERGSCGVERDLLLHRLKGIYLDAFRQALGDPQNAHALWEGDYGLILFGGGSWLRPFREPMLTRAHPDIRRDPSLVEPGKPFDLREAGGGAHVGDAYFSHGAYGAATSAALRLEAESKRRLRGKSIP